MPLFTLNFSDDDPLFCMAFHPEKPQFILGFATGRVVSYEYKPAEDGQTTCDKLWATKRHKESCRAVAYDHTGQFAVSCGSDGIVKKFDAQTGKVIIKTEVDAPISALSINEAYIAIGDENGTLHILNLDLGKHRTYELEDVESISAICPLHTVNKHNFAVSGDMHVFKIDARKDDVVSKSEDQEDDVLCGCIASESRSAWGMSEGVLTVWKNKGLGDQQQRVKLSKEGSVDAVIAGEQDDHVVAGTSDGWVAEIDLVSAQVLHKAHHNREMLEDEVAYLDFDYEYRLVSASMTLLKVWNEDELEKTEKEEKIALEKKQSDQLKRAGSQESSKKKKKSKKNATSTVPEAFADLMG